MFPYYLLIILPLYYGVAEMMLQPNRDVFFVRKHSNNSIILFFVLWFVLLSLRHILCGIDLKSYGYDFCKVCSISFSDSFGFYGGFEPLYWALNWFVGHIYFDFRLFIIITAFLCTAVTGWFYWKESESASLTLVLFITNACYKMMYSGLKQSIAMLFVVPAYYFTKKQKIIPFILTVLFARYFHQSAFIMLLLYPIYHIPLRSKYFIIILLFVACFFLMKVQIFNMVFPFLPEKYLGYSLADDASGYSVWAFFVLLLIFSFVVTDEKKMNREISGLRNILVLTTLLQGFAPIHSLAMRMNYYFIMLFPVIIPKLINRPKYGMENIALFVKYFLVLFLFVFYLFGVCSMERNTLLIYPYHFFWE